MCNAQLSTKEIEALQRLQEAINRLPKSLCMEYEFGDGAIEVRKNLGYEKLSNGTKMAVSQLVATVKKRKLVIFKGGK